MTAEKDKIMCPPYDMLGKAALVPLGDYLMWGPKNGYATLQSKLLVNSRGGNREMREAGWRVHINVHSDDMAKAYPIVADKVMKFYMSECDIMAPEHNDGLKKGFEAGTAANSRKFAIKHLGEDLNMQWELFMGELESALKAAGIRPGPMLECEAPVHGSQYATITCSAVLEGKRPDVPADGPLADLSILPQGLESVPDIQLRALEGTLLKPAPDETPGPAVGGIAFDPNTTVKRPRT